jgi:hypothetical protein
MLIGVVSVTGTGHDPLFFLQKPDICCDVQLLREALILYVALCKISVVELVFGYMCAVAFLTIDAAYPVCGFNQ